MRGERVFAPKSPLAWCCRLTEYGWPETPAPVRSPFSLREIDVLIHLAQGYSVKQCAKALGIGTSTAGNHKSR